MQRLNENYCRLCTKAFCCKKCRNRHETDFHKVISQCDICIYGNFIFENIDEAILQHVKDAHLPLNCVYCKRIFNSIEDIILHRKCPVQQIYKEDSPKTPLFKPPEILISVDDQDSPILQELHRKEALNFIFKLATSTPMQTAGVNFDKSKDEAITPVEGSQISNKSIIKKTQSIKKSDDSSKRRVTFSETPGTTYSTERNSSHEHQTDSIKSPAFVGSELSKSESMYTPKMSIPTEKFYSAKSEIDEPSIKLQSSRYEGNKTSVLHVADITTSDCSHKQSELVGAQIDIHKDVITEENNTNNQTNCNNNCNIAAEAQQKCTSSNDISMEICSPTSDGEQSDSIVNPNFDEVERSDSGNLYTPKLVIPTEEFYSAKAQLDDSTAKGKSSKYEINKSSVLQHGVSYTPICVPKSSEAVSDQGDVYKTQDKTLHIITEQTGCKNINTNVTKTEHDTTSITEVSMEMCTPNPTNTISIQKTLCKETKEQVSLEDELMRKEKVCSVSNTTGCETLWQSAINPDDNDLENGKENMQPVEDNQLKKESDPFGNTQKRRVSVVMPTPVLKRTDMHMKIRLPAHFASTPVTSNEIEKSKPPNAIENFYSRVSQETPYKTPQGNCLQFVELKSFGSRIESFSNIEAGPSRTEDKSASLSENHDNYTSTDIKQIRGLNRDQYLTRRRNLSETSINFTSTSSMTESNLWSSMTRVVKSILGFSKRDQECSTDLVSRSLKRQLSEDEPACFEAPQRKRFKYTDIKCRKPIRTESVLLPTTSDQVATFEFVKSVSTVYDCTKKSKCDKATQTDDYPMYA